jgi:hypothetical protein
MCPNLSCAFFTDILTGLMSWVPPQKSLARTIFIPNKTLFLVHIFSLNSIIMLFFLIVMLSSHPVIIHPFDCIWLMLKRFNRPFLIIVTSWILTLISSLPLLIVPTMSPISLICSWVPFPIVITPASVIFLVSLTVTIRCRVNCCSSISNPLDRITYDIIIIQSSK